MRTSDGGRAKLPVALAIVLTLGLAASRSAPLLAQAAIQGRWTVLSGQTPINPVHVALMNTGEVLIVAGSGNVATETHFQAAVWDRASQTFRTQTLGWDMFCNGMVTLPDGRVFINGGNLRYDPFYGEPRNAVFDPASGLFTDVQNMTRGRWYPTTTVLGDGRVMTFSGLLDTGGTNTTIEIYTVGSGWSAPVSGGLDAAALSAHAPEHGWSSLLCRVGSGLPVLQSIDKYLVGERHDQPQRVAILRHVGPAAADAGEWIPAARHDPGWRQPRNGDNGNHRPFRRNTDVAVRTPDVAAADPDECDDPAQWEGAGRWRIVNR